MPALASACKKPACGSSPELSAQRHRLLGKCGLVVRFPPVVAGPRRAIPVALIRLSLMSAVRWLRRRHGNVNSLGRFSPSTFRPAHSYFLCLRSYVVDSGLYCVRVQLSVLTFLPCRKTDGLSEAQRCAKLVTLTPSSDDHRHRQLWRSLQQRSPKDVVAPCCTRVLECPTIW